MWRKKREEAHLNAELRYHLEKLERDYIAEGMEPTEARRQAQLEFGGLEQIKEDCRDLRGRWLEDFWKDLRYAARTLRRSPGFLAVAILSLGLGIGANTAIFTLINAVLLRTIPVKDTDRLVQPTRLSQEGKAGSVSYPLFEQLRDNMKSLALSSAQRSSRPAITIDGTEEVVSGELVSGAHYQILELEPAIGRLLEPFDELAAVISYNYWQRRFGRDPSAIGKTLTIGKQAFTIVGVTPRGYQGARTGNDPDVTLPLLTLMTPDDRREATLYNFNMLSRLAPRVTREQANAELQVHWKVFLQRIAAEEVEKNRPGILRQRAEVLSAAGGFSSLKNDYSDALFILMGITGFVLLLASANLSGLLLARAASRRREISIRLAIGAGTGRLIRQFLTESLLLAVLGGATGFLLARWLSSALVAMIANGGTLVLSTDADWRVLTFTAGLSLLVCIAAGLIPATHALRTDLKAARHQRLGKSLVVAQLSISMMLLVGATLFVTTLVNLYKVDRGVRTDGVLTFNLRSTVQYPQQRGSAVIADLLRRLRTMPGVSSASATAIMPLGGSFWVREVHAEGYTFRADEDEGVAFGAVAPDYFTTVGTPLLSGREFHERDTATSPKVAIVNESFARYFFGHQSAVGRKATSNNVTYEIVGVVKDAKYRNLQQEIVKTFYIPCMQREGAEPSSFWYVARVAGGDPARLTPLLEKFLRETDPGLRLGTALPYAAIVDRGTVRERLMATLGSFFGILALLVGCLGIFGVMTFQVSRRMNEIGVRLALGATRSGIVGLVMKEVAVMLACGCVIGGAAALTLTGVTRTMLFGITPTSPAAFGIAALALGIAACAAGWLPARRASLVDPTIALRHE